MDYAIIKTLHIVSSTLLFGTGLGTAFFMWQANRSKDVAAIAHTAKRVVLADWLFTLPTVVIQPASGYALMILAGLPLTGWIALSLGLFALAGLCWLPVVWLQIRMHKLAAEAQTAQTPLPPIYWSYARTWTLLGIPAFSAMIVVFFLMVAKPF